MVDEATQAHEVNDELDTLLAFQGITVGQVKAWRWGAISGWGLLAGALVVCAILVLKPPPEPRVQYLLRDAGGVVETDGASLPISKHTPTDAQYVSMLRQYILYFRERGRDEPQMRRAWDWLRWHTCGLAAELFDDTLERDKPFERVGLKRLHITNLRLAKTDLPHHFTATWKETRLEGLQQPAEIEQSVMFRVARRAFEDGLWPINPFGLCVAQYGGLIR